MASSSSDRPEVMDSSGSGEDVFLSHSGKQKNFVEHLYHALLRADQRVFFDKYTLLRGYPFPPAIMRALHGCKLGVIVVSKDFFTSRWPMLELEILQGRGTQLLPLFLALTPNDLKSKLSDWQSKWKQIAENEQQERRWATAVRQLRSINGIEYKQHMSEFEYIDTVVTHICNIIRPNPMYDQSMIRGHQALIEEIKGYFEVVANANKGEKACIVGLHGVGGLGKTTLCGSVVNIYNSQYHGRSCLIEFPTDCNKLEVFRECIMALKKLANLSKCLCEGIRSFDQVDSQQK